MYKFSLSFYYILELALSGQKWLFCGKIQPVQDEQVRKIGGQNRKLRVYIQVQNGHGLL